MLSASSLVICLGLSILLQLDLLWYLDPPSTYQTISALFSSAVLFAVLSVVLSAGASTTELSGVTSAAGVSVTVLSGAVGTLGKSADVSTG
jgi:hypothetical protein